MKNRYFTLILKDNYNADDRLKIVGKIVEVEIYGNGLHYIIAIFNETQFPKYARLDLGYYEHKPIDNKLWNLIL